MARTPIEKEGRAGDPRYNQNAIVDRRQFERQLFDASGNPTPTCYAFAGRMKMEVGGQGPNAQMAFAETVLNRCASRSNTVDYEIRNHGKYSYWPKRQSEPGYSNNKQFIDIIRKVVMNGTNLTCGATGNDGVGDGINTSAPTLYVANGERYSIEHFDRKWHANKFASLIRGIGKFIGDVAGAIGQGIAAVAKGVVEVGKWIFGGIGSAISPTHANPHPPKTVQDRPVHAGERQPAIQPRQPELLPRIEPQPSASSRWIFKTSVPRDAPLPTQDPKSKPGHRPQV